MIKLLLILIATVITTYAQEETTQGPTSNEPAEQLITAPTPVPTPMPAPVATKKDNNTKDKDFTADFNQLRGNGYNGLGNPATAFNINSMTLYPSQIGGKKLVYIEPVNERGVAYMPFGDKTAFIDFTSSEASLGLTRIGLANNDNSFGLGLGLGLGINLSSMYNDTASLSTNTLLYGNTFFVNSSFNLDGMMGYGQIGYLTSANSTRTKTKENGKVTSDIDQDYFKLWLNFGFTKGLSSSNKLAWTTEIQLGRNNYSTTTTTTDTTLTDIKPGTNVFANLIGNIGGVALQNKRAKLIIGSNNNLELKIFDDLKDSAQSNISTELNITPNAMVEYAVRKNWVTFAGVHHTINITLNKYKNTYTALPSDVKINYLNTSLTTNHTSAQAGLRYQNQWIALEASVNDNVFSNGTSSLFNGTGVFGNFGIFVKF